MDIKNFKSISLDQMDKVKLMNRVDKKYWFNVSCLPAIFQAISDDYYALEIENNKVLKYSTTYYDTVSNQMFIAHHNGKLNRFKIRKRTYVVSGINFLEIKFKNNKGRTIKSRVPTLKCRTPLSSKEINFIKDNAPFTGLELSPVLNNEFSRITLVNKNFKERCTVDINLTFRESNKSVGLENLCVLEIKTDNNSAKSKIEKVLYESNLKPEGFSKYCMGRVLLDSSIKHNRFKQKIRQLEKILYS